MSRCKRIQDGCVFVLACIIVYDWFLHFSTYWAYRDHYDVIPYLWFDWLSYHMWWTVTWGFASVLVLTVVTLRVRRYL